MTKNIFVFVVCGSKEHIDTLHFSLKYLKRFSKNEIYVITDVKRNEVPIIHDVVFNIDTPEKFNHHQASIYLKTGLYKFVPPGNNYCYLDTDVIALSNECDSVFDQFSFPITFAPDHCKVRKFSPYAVNCECLKRWSKDRENYNSALSIHDKNKLIKDPSILKKARELKFLFETIKGSVYKKILTGIRYLFSLNFFKLDNEFYFDKKNRTWHLNTGEIVMYEVDVKKIERLSGLKFNKWNQKWINTNGEDIWQDECGHLTEFIYRDFDIQVKDKDWQHWNGGVFIFNDSSRAFLESWHEKTLKIFDYPDWKTRDQGTLIATAWEFRLQNHSTLDKKWNLIADYNNSFLKWIDKETVQLSVNEYIKPVLIHVYHHFGDRDWSFWNVIENKS